MTLRLLPAVVLLFTGASCDDGSDWDERPDGDVTTDVADGGVPDAPADVIEDVEGEEVGGDDAGDPEVEAPFPLTSDEIDLILAGDADTRMAIVTNRTAEGDAFLHEVSIPVDPTDPTVRHLVSRMRVTLAAEMGIGLAAPQVGIHRRLFLARRTDQAGRPTQVFYNPAIVEYSTETGMESEGCISIPGASPSIRRSKWIVVDYQSAGADPIVGEMIGSTTDTNAAYAARIVQHEYDHLEGILVPD